MTPDLLFRPVLWLLLVAALTGAVLAIHKHGLPTLLRRAAWMLWALASGIEQGCSGFRYGYQSVKENQR